MAGNWEAFLKTPRRAEIQAILERLHAQQEAERAAQGEWDKLPPHKLLELERMKYGPQDVHTSGMDTLSLTPLQRASGQSHRSVPPLSIKDNAQRNKELNDEMSFPSKMMALGAGLIGGVAAPMLVPSAPILSAAAINALSGLPINMAFDAPEGVGQDAAAGAAMGYAASRIHPLAAIPAALSSYIATDIPEAEANPLAALRKSLSNPAWLKSDIAAKHAVSDASRQAQLSSFMQKLVESEQRMTSGVDPETAFLLRRNVLRLPVESVPRAPQEQLPIEGFAAGGSIAGAAKRMAQRAMSRAEDLPTTTVAPRGVLSVVTPEKLRRAGFAEDRIKALEEGRTDTREKTLDDFMRKHFPTEHRKVEQNVPDEYASGGPVQKDSHPPVDVRGIIMQLMEHHAHA